MSNSIRIKRRASTGATGKPTSLKNGELAYNEADDILYYGYGVSGSNAAQIKEIAGPGAPAATFTNYVNKTTAQTVAGVKTLTSLLNANAGIAVDTNKFTVADGSGNTVIDGSLRVGGEGFIVTNAGKVSSGEWQASDVAVAHGGTGASSAAAARTNLGVDAAGTDNSTNVTLSGSYDYITASGTGNQTLTLNQIDLAADVTGTLPAAKVGVLPASKITSGTIDKDRLPLATAAAKGAIELFSDTEQTVVPNAVSATASRTYGVQLNSDDQAVVNVPWSVRAITAGGNTLAATETLAFTAGSNVTITESNGAVTIASPHRTVQADGSPIGSSETLNLIGGTNVTLSESGGAITIASTDTNTNTTYDLSVPVGTKKIRLAGSDGTNDDVEIAAGTNITVTRNNANKLTIASSATATASSIGLGGGASVAFGNLELGSGETSATLKGPATLTIDPATHGDETGKVIIEGDLQVEGTTTTVNSTTIEVADKALDLAPTAATNALINEGGFRLGTDGNSPRGGRVEFLFSNANTRMELSSAMKITGGLQDTVIDGGTF